MFRMGLHDGDGKKWAKFVAMQRGSANLNYFLNTMRGTVESHLETLVQPFKTFQALKIVPTSVSLQKH